MRSRGGTIIVLISSQIAALIESCRLVWDGELRGDALLLRLGAPLQPLINTESAGTVDLADQGSICSLYEAPLGDWSTFDLAPGRLVLCQVAAALELGNDLAGAIASLSHLARVGLATHVTSPWVLAGWKGYLTLELQNLGPAVLRIYRNMPVARLVLFELTARTDNVGPHPFYGSDPSYLGSRFASEFPFVGYSR
jgi:deoxycytidine triphosphate deaminase